MSGEGTSLRDYFVPFGDWRPDSIEFDQNYMEKVVNFFPVYSGYRPAAKLIQLSASPNTIEAVTGSMVHRTSEPVGVETLQPDQTLEKDPETIVVPDGKAVHEVWRGIFPIDSEYLSYIASGTDLEASVQMNPAVNAWDGAGNIAFLFRYRVLSGGSGNVSMRFSWGYINSLGAEVEIGNQVISGTLGALGDDLWKGISNSDAVASFLETDLYARARVNIDAQSSSNTWPVETFSEGEYEPVGAATLHESVDKSGGPDDTIYAEGPPLSETPKLFSVKVDDIGETTLLNHEIHVRFLVNVAGVTLHARIGEGETLLESFTQAVTHGPSPQDHTFNITPSVIEQIEDTDNLVIAVGFSGGTPPGDETNLPAAAPNYTGAFSIVGSGDLGDSNDATGWESNEAGLGIVDSLKSRFELDDPASGSGTYKVRVRGREGTIVVRLYDVDSGFEVTSEEFELTSSHAWYEMDFEDHIFKITNWGRLDVQVDRKNGAAAAVTRIVEKEIVAPGGMGEPQVQEVYYAAPAEQLVDVSFAQAQADLAGNISPGDTIRMHFGAGKRLYTVEDPTEAWNDVSKGGLYTVEGGKSWDFTSFGDMAIATNFIDPVQVLTLGGSQYRDLFGFDATGTPIAGYAAAGGETPRARFVATINSFLCLASVDPNSYVDGRPYSFWCSRISIPYEIYPANATLQSGLFQIVATDGEITGLLGGEYGFIFKENSVYRAEYVGFSAQDPTVFNFPEISRETGTPYPRSIVRWEQDVYFWGSGGIYVIEGGTTLREIGEGQVSKYIFDSLFESLALSTEVRSDDRENSSKVVGERDPYSGLIVWSYRTEFDSPFENGSLICYNPQRDRLTVILGEDRVRGGFKHSEIMSLGNQQQSIDSVARSLIFVERTTAQDTPDYLMRFGVDETYEGEMQTNTIGSHMFPGVEIGQEIVVHTVQPIFRTEPSNRYPEIEIKVTAAQAPIVERNPNEEDTVFWSDARPDGVVPLNNPLSGEWFKFNVRLREFDKPATKELLGLRLEYNIRGVD